MYLPSYLFHKHDDGVLIRVVLIFNLDYCSKKGTEEMKKKLNAKLNYNDFIIIIL